MANACTWNVTSQAANTVTAASPASRCAARAPTASARDATAASSSPDSTPANHT